MEVSQAVRYDRLARWVKTALAKARGDGMTDEDIRKATGLSPRTWHRWQANDFGVQGPQVTSINQFCDGLGIPRAIPYNIMGWSGEFPPVDPNEPPELPRDFRIVLRRLSDPHTSEAEKFHIRATMRALAARPQATVGAAGGNHRKE